MFWQKKSHTFIDPFLPGLIGWHRAALLHGKLVHSVALVHLTALAGVQYLKAFPVTYPQGGGPAPLGLISSVLGEAEAEGSHFAWVVDMPDHQSPSHPPRPGIPWEIFKLPCSPDPHHQRFPQAQSPSHILSPFSYNTLYTYYNTTLKPLVLFLLWTGLSLGSKLQYLERKTVCQAVPCSCLCSELHSIALQASSGSRGAEKDITLRWEGLQSHIQRTETGRKLLQQFLQTNPPEAVLLKLKIHILCVPTTPLFYMCVLYAVESALTPGNPVSE